MAQIVSQRGDHAGKGCTRRACLPSHDLPMKIDVYQPEHLDLDSFVAKEIGADDLKEAFARVLSTAWSHPAATIPSEHVWLGYAPPSGHDSSCQVPKPFPDKVTTMLDGTPTEVGRGGKLSCT